MHFFKSYLIGTFSINKPLFMIFLAGTLLLSACTSTNKSQVRKVSDDDIYQANYQLAEAAKRYGDYKQAIEIYLTQLKKEPNNVELHEKLAQSYFDDKQFEKSLWWAKKNADRDASLANLLLFGRCQLANEQTEAALKTLTQAQAIAPKEPLPSDQTSLQLVLALGTALDTSKQHKKAQEHYKNALNYFPINSKINNNLALSFLLMGEHKKAINILEKLYESDSASEKIKQNLILALVLSGQNNKAEAIKLETLTDTQKKQNISTISQIGIYKNGQ